MALMHDKAIPNEDRGRTVFTWSMIKNKLPACQLAVLNRRLALQFFEEGREMSGLFE